MTRLLLLSLFAMGLYASSARSADYDIVVYGGTSSGVIAAVQAARLGKVVALVEPGRHLGGLTSGGLGFVDVGSPRTIGGLGREYFGQVWQHYQFESHWTWERKHPIKGQHAPLPEDDHTLWTVEPSVAEAIFDRMAADRLITVVRGERLDRQKGVRLDGQRIAAITMESGRAFTGKMFIDATYEGDLMAAAGVSYVVGREANAEFHETLNGMGPGPRSGRFPEGVDPYRIKGDPGSGLLPRVHPDRGGQVGDGDRGVQAYNYRLCLTKVPENRVPIEKPDGYDEGQYELLFRYLEVRDAKDKSLKNDPIPNAKTDTNNLLYVSTDYVGMNWDYPDADYAARERIAREHQQWQQGLVWTLQHHPRVPLPLREEYAPWGLAKDEFTDNAHWPHQLYIREARRMRSDYVVTEHIASGKEPVADPVGLGSYHMDSHAIKLYVTPAGFVSSEGGMFAPIPRPFGISYRAIVPKRGQCENLLVPVCASATHAAYGTIRMEPVFMVLGESAATAASLAIDRNTAVQDVPYGLLRERLLAGGQRLDWTEESKITTPPAP